MRIQLTSLNLIGWSMSSSIFMPDKIRVGFQDCAGTYTKRLAYVIYYDNKGKIRKEQSWNSWRDKKIEPLECNNVPTSGFVLNKKVGGYDTGWNHRQTYTRIHDPRGFEFEITIENLLYILENTDCIKGKGLSGEFVYGWDAGNLILLPTSAPEFVEISDYTNLVKEGSIKAKDLIPGATYLTNKNEQVVYLGKFEAFKPYWYWRDDESQKSRGKQHFFFTGCTYSKFITRSSPSGYLIKLVTDSPIDDYAEIMEDLEGQSIYSPLDPSKDEYVPVTSNTLDDTIHLQYKGARFEASYHKYSLTYGNPFTFYNKSKGPQGWGYYNDPLEAELKKLTEGIRTEKDALRVALELGCTTRQRYLRNGKKFQR
jgi:hypothetical protein